MDDATLCFSVKREMDAFIFYIAGKISYTNFNLGGLVGAGGGEIPGKIFSSKSCQTYWILLGR